MKIKRFNEELENNKFEDFQELLVEKFFGDDLGDLGSYRVLKQDDKGRFRHVKMYFNFVVLDEDEMEILLKMRDFLTSKCNLTGFILSPKTFGRSEDYNTMIECYVAVEHNKQFEKSY